MNLRTEYQFNPIGIDSKKPRLSWQIQSEKQNVMQTGYRLQFSATSDFVQVFYDTKIVESPELTQIKYPGPSLSPHQRLYWRVMVLTTQGKSSFSDPAFFETGFMDSSWEGKFIEPAEKFVSESPCPVLKKKFQLREKPISATLYITALGMYRAHINGTQIDQDMLAPGWTSYSNHIQYQTYDVSDMFTKGENMISVILGSGWYMGRLAWENKRNHYGDRGALLAQLIIKYQDTTTQTIATDETWKSCESAVIFSEIYDGEKYDARKDSGLGAASYDSQYNAKLYNAADFNIIGQNTPGVRVIDEISPVNVITTPKGDTVLDFGQNMVGWVRVEANGKKDEEIHLLHGEVMQGGEFFNDNMRTAKTEAIYILSGNGKETFEPHFTFFGFRYVKVDKYPGKVKPENFKGIVISSYLEYAGSFECSNTKVNKLFQNIIWGQKGNFIDIPSDCPQRDERLGWTGDTQMFAATACYNSLAAPFYAKWLKDLAYDQYENGGVPSVIPDVLHNEIASCAWGDAAVIIPMTLYEIYQDKHVLEKQYSSMKKWVEYIRNRSRGESIWETDFHFSDWLSYDGYGLTKVLGATPVPLVATAFYYHSTQLLAKAADILGKGKDKDEYEKLANKIKKAFNREFVTPAGRISGETQTAYTLSLHFGLLDKKLISVASKHLCELVRREKHRITTGFAGTSYIAHVLSNNSYNEDAYKMLLNEECPGWLYPVNMGATTIWERWDSLMPDGTVNPDSMNSFNHYAYGSIGHWLYSNVLGIMPLQGYSIFQIAPKPSKQLEWAKGCTDTLYGKVTVSWEYEKDKFSIEIKIPCNCKAHVILPNAKAQDICHKGEVQQTEDGALITLGSGIYSFSY